MPVEALLSFIEATGRARTHAGLAQAVALTFGARRVELVDASGAGWLARAGQPTQPVVRRSLRAALDLRAGWRCSIAPLPALPAAQVRRVLNLALEQLEVLSRVARLSEQAHRDQVSLREEVQRVTRSDDLVAESPSMRELVHHQLPLVARQDTTVLLRGETGTGKEVLARRIHALSTRAHRPLHAINCGALPESLIESALFGHERGAFTGAEQTTAGIFERASGATLLLDEVGDLPRHAQVKLLRVLQEGQVTRVGAAEPIAVDVRVIAATHRPLESMIHKGTFREDLFYRLAVFPIDVPPLRERLEDLDALVASLLARLATRQHKSVPRVPPALLARLRAHRWPGNARELQNVLERALLISDPDTLTLPPGFERHAPSAPRGVETWREGSKRVIEAALSRCEGRIYGKGGAAELLGLKPSTLQSKMGKLGLRIR